MDKSASAFRKPVPDSGGQRNDPGNRVRLAQATRSKNLFESDRIFQHLFRHHLSQEGRNWMQPRWHQLGDTLANRMDDLSLQADKNGPVLRKRNLFGETVDELIFHPAYRELEQIAVHSGMFEVKWEPSCRKHFHRESHRLGFSAGLLFAMGEAGLYCPLCMTDGVARILDHFADPKDRDRLLPHIFTSDPHLLYTGAMFLTEKAGGSDVGANRVRAVQVPQEELPFAVDLGEGESWYRLYGEKWFCSNAGAEIALALARTDPSISGTRGLGIFLVEPYTADGQRNPREVIRLKEKLGVRSMASAELYFDGTLAKRIGAEGDGFAIMAEMINLSRLYNAVTAVALARRALTETWQYLTYRTTFGKPVLEHALVKERLEALGSAWLGELHLCWRAISALDAADQGDEAEAVLARLLTPMVKRSSAEFAVYAIRECMELTGGIGYLEEGILPKLLRDANVLPIWEGSGNIMLLDMLRAWNKVGCGDALEKEWSAAWEADAQGESWLRRLRGLREAVDDLNVQEPDIAQYRSRELLEQLTLGVQATLLKKEVMRHPAPWFAPALSWYARRFLSEVRAEDGPLSTDELESLMGFSW